MSTAEKKKNNGILQANGQIWKTSFERGNQDTEIQLITRTHL